MAFGSDIVHSVTVIVGDPGADNKQIHLWRAPVAAEIKRAYIAVQNAQGAGSAGAFALHNFGTGGTAVGGTVAAALGGTATASRLSAATPSAYTISEGTMAAGEWLVLDYQETGDWVEQQVAITFDYVLGIGA
jgi:hypothetical protein